MAFLFQKIGGTGQTDGRTDGERQHLSRPLGRAA